MTIDQVVQEASSMREGEKRTFTLDRTPTQLERMGITSRLANDLGRLVKANVRGNSIEIEIGPIV